MSIVTVAADHPFADYRVIRVRLNYKSPRPLEIAFLTPNNTMIVVNFAGEDFARFEAFSARAAECWLRVPEGAYAEFDALKKFVLGTVRFHSRN
jgi:hypothetical protein